MKISLLLLLMLESHVNALDFVLKEELEEKLA